MSSSTYCQGLQSCPDLKNLTEPRVLRLQLAPPTSSSSTDKNVHIGGDWTFLQSLDMKNPNQASNITENKDTIYIPPTCKSPGGGGLSEESLEMCTERLGSESGNDGGFEQEFALLSADTVHVQLTRPTKRTAEKETCNYKLPPPLTSISGGQNVHVKQHREGGRLVLKAVTVSSPRRFQAERIDGRLKIHLMGNLNDSEAEEEEEEEVDDMSGNVQSTEMENMGRKGGRCKEGGESSCCFFNSETFWVATS